MKAIAFLLFAPFLASSLKVNNFTFPAGSRTTYASWAQRNALNKDDFWGKNYQHAICFDYFNQTGSSYWIQDYISDLSDSGWSNRFTSCCFYGVWILYDHRDYNKINKNVSRNIQNCCTFKSTFENIIIDRKPQTIGC